jgi:chromosome segregation ATPase
MPRQEIIDDVAIKKESERVAEANKEIKTENETLKKTSQELQDKIDAQQKELSLFDKKIQEAREFLNTEEGKKWAVGTIGELNAEIKRLTEIFNQKKTEVQSIDDEKTRKTSEFKVFLDSQTNELQLKFYEKTGQINDLDEEIAIKTKKNEEASKNNNSLAETNGKLSTENNLLEQRKNLLNGEIIFLEGQKEGVKISIEAKINEQNKIEQTLSGIKQEISIKNTEIEQSKKDLQEIKGQIETVRTKHSEVLRRTSNILEREAQTEELRKYIKTKYEKIGEPWDDTNN